MNLREQRNLHAFPSLLLFLSFPPFFSENTQWNGSKTRIFEYNSSIYILYIISSLLFSYSHSDYIPSSDPFTYWVDTYWMSHLLTRSWDVSTSITYIYFITNPLLRYILAPAATYVNRNGQPKNVAQVDNNMAASPGLGPRLGLLRSQARPKPTSNLCQGWALAGPSRLRAWGPAWHITRCGGTVQWWLLLATIYNVPWQVTMVQLSGSWWTRPWDICMSITKNKCSSGKSEFYLKSTWI
jgi:hypothetical protein